MVLFYDNTEVEAIDPEDSRYANAWFSGEVRSSSKAGYLIHFHGYSDLEDRVLDESDLRFPLRIAPFSHACKPQKDDKVEVHHSGHTMDRNVKGWWKATVIEVLQGRVKVRFANELLNKENKKRNFWWEEVRLISRGAGYTTNFELPPFCNSVRLSNESSILKNVRDAWDSATKKRSDTKHDIIADELIEDQTTTIANAILHGYVHPDVELGLIEDESNPVKKFAFGENAYGVFAKRKIPANAILGLYAGEVRDHDEFEFGVTVGNEFEKVYTFELEQAVELFEANLNVDACKFRSLTAYVNDYRVAFSDKGNLSNPRTNNSEFIGVIFDGFPYLLLITIAKIQAGEEILTDYGKNFWIFFKGVLERQIGLRHQMQYDDVRFQALNEKTARMEAELLKKTEYETYLQTLLVENNIEFNKNVPNNGNDVKQVQQQQNTHKRRRDVALNRNKRRRDTLEVSDENIEVEEKLTRRRSGDQKDQKSLVEESNSDEAIDLPNTTTTTTTNGQMWQKLSDEQEEEGSTNQDVTNKISPFMYIGSEDVRIDTSPQSSEDRSSDESILAVEVTAEESILLGEDKNGFIDFFAMEDEQEENVKGKDAKEVEAKERCAWIDVEMSLDIGFSPQDKVIVDETEDTLGGMDDASVKGIEEGYMVENTLDETESTKGECTLDEVDGARVNGKGVESSKVENSLDKAEVDGKVIVAESSKMDKLGGAKRKKMGTIDLPIELD